MKEYTVKEFAKILNVSDETIRRWDRNGKLPCSKRTEAGYRVYTEDDVVKAKFSLSFVVSRDFDVFKSSVCHHVKYDLKKWLLDTIQNDRINEYLKINKPEYAYYVLL